MEVTRRCPTVPRKWASMEGTTKHKAQILSYNMYVFHVLKKKKKNTSHDDSLNSEVFLYLVHDQNSSVANRFCIDRKGKGAPSG